MKMRIGTLAHMLPLFSGRVVAIWASTILIGCLWVSSYWVTAGAYVRFDGNSGRHAGWIGTKRWLDTKWRGSVALGPGHLQIYVRNDRLVSGPLDSAWELFATRLRPEERADWAFRGLWFLIAITHANDWSIWSATLAIPIWFVWLAPMGGWYLRFRLRRRRADRRTALCLCFKCGYDLRAHRHGQRCPECGTPIPPGKDSKPPPTDPPGEPLPPG